MDSNLVVYNIRTVSLNNNIELTDTICYAANRWIRLGSQPLLEQNTAEAGRSSTCPTCTHMVKTPSSQTNLAGNRVGTEVTIPTTV